MIKIQNFFLKILTVTGLMLSDPINAAIFFKEDPIAPATFMGNDTLYYQTQDGFQIIATNKKHVVDWVSSYAHLFADKPDEVEIATASFTLFNNGNFIFDHDASLLFSEHQRSKVINTNYMNVLHNYGHGTNLYVGHTDLNARIYQWPDNEAMLGSYSTFVSKLKTISIPVPGSLPLMLTGCVCFARFIFRGSHLNFY